MRTHSRLTQCLWLWFAALGLIAVMLPATTTRAQMYKGTQLVKADLIADTTAIAAGKPFTVGLRLKMAPKWHTYWQNSGDAGLPTKIDWQLPEGFQAGPLQWPIPVRIDSAGDIVNYGYGEEVVLLTEITPPAQLPAGEVAIKGKAVWLVCAELCVPGDADVALKLPAGGDAAPANGPVFAESRALLPKVDHEAVKVTERKMEGDNLVIGMGVAVPEMGNFGVEFFPLPPEGVEIGHPSTKDFVSGGTHGIVVKLPVTSNPAKADKIGGVLVVTSADGDRTGYVIAAKDGSTAGDGSVTNVSSVPTNGVGPTAQAGTVGPAAPPWTGGAGGGMAAKMAAPAPASGGSLGYYLLLGLLGGLILNVMPCVLPVISLKLFSFVKQANEEPARVFRLGLAYAAGVFAWFLSFAALVVVLKAAGREVGNSLHLQNPWFIVGACAAVFVFSLNLLGVFEFILPGVFGGALASASERNGGYAGAFLQGLLATVFGSACTAPVLGGALTFAFAQKPFAVFAMFAAIATGMSAPFVLLAAQPRWLRFLPKPGVWMERVKQGTGFLMLATVLWLLSVLGAMKGADAVVWMGALLLVLGVVCWIQGSFNTLLASGRVRAASLVTMAVLLLAGGWFGLRQVGEAQLPAASGGSFTERLQTSLQTGRPVFIDFTAAWCVNCKVNEKLVLAKPTVQRALKESNTVFLTADWTVRVPDITALLKKFGAAGVPLYVIYPADRSREPIVLPELLTEQMVLDGLKSAAGKQTAPGKIAGL